jgi:ABC-2 type transport system ATP-binding protein
MTGPALTIEHVTKRFHEQDAVCDISLSVNPCEIVAVKGLAGAGKTTLIKLAAGLLQPTSGMIAVGGRQLIPGSPANASLLGAAFREEGVYERLTAREYLTLFRKLHGSPASRIDEVIREAGLLDRQDQVLRKFTENLTSRLRTARALLHRPAVLLFDEPTFGLDLETTEIIRKMIMKAASEGAAVLLATSSYEEAASIAHRTGVLNRGRIDAWEKAEEISQAAPNPPPSAGAHMKFEKIPARVNDRILLFNPLELIYIESQEGQSVLHTANESFPCPLTLSELEERLKPLGFFRSHRSYIVNLQRVREVIPWTRNSYSLVLDDARKTTIPLSKNSMKELEGLIGV